MSVTDVYKERLELETDYVAALVAGVACKKAEPDDGIAICPPELLTQGGLPHAVLSALAELNAARQPLTLMEIYRWIAQQRQNARCAMPETSASELIDIFSHSLHTASEDVQFLAEKCRREGLKRKAEATLMGLVSEAQQYGTETGQMSAALTRLAEELDGGAPEDASIDGVMDRLMAKMAAGSAAAPVPTPWDGLNRVLRGGLVPGELCVLAARPGMGKTAFAGNIAVETARAYGSVLFVSLEVKDETVAARIMAREARIDSRVFREGISAASNVAQKIAVAREGLRGLPLRVVEKSVVRLTPREVRRLAKTTKDIALVVVDYLQLMEPDEKSQSREREIASMSRAMKRLALDCDVPVLLLSQLNRGVEETGRQPQLSDLRESGAIEQDADIVMFLHALKKSKLLPKMPVQCIVAKGRSSGTGVATMLFDKPLADFVPDDNGVMWGAQGQQDSPARQDYDL